jgi:nucleotide-binding universal stress UspA family protein
VPQNPLAALRSILVPISGAEAAYHALAVVCEMARRTRMQVYLLHVIEVPRSLPLDAQMSAEVQRGEAMLERAESIAREFGVRAEGDLVQARQAAHAIVDEVVERGADALVIGVDYDRPHGRFALGALPEYLLEHAPVQVWLIRYPPAENHVPGESRRA